MRYNISTNAWINCRNKCIATVQPNIGILRCINSQGRLNSIQDVNVHSYIPKKNLDLNLCNTIQVHYKHWQGLISSVWTNLGERQIADSLVHQQIGHHWRGEGDMRAKIFKHFNLILDDISKFRNYRVKIRREICRCNLRESRLIPFGLASRPSFASPLLERLTLIVS